MKVILLFLSLIFSGSWALAQNTKWEAMEIEADTLMARENYQSALSLYNQVIKAADLKDPAKYFLLYKRAICFYSLGQFENALTDVDRFIALQPDFPQAKLLKAYLGRELGSADIQLSALNDLLQSDPKNHDLLKWRASAFLGDGQYEEARRDIDAARKIRNDAELETYTGISYYYESQPDSAIIYFDKAITLDSTYITAYIYAGSLSLDEEAYDLALVYLNKALELDPANLTIQFYRGIALVEKKELDNGCRCLAKAFHGGIDDAGGYLKEYCYSIEEL